MNEIVASWYKECRAHALKTETLKSFQQCLSQVTALEEASGGSIETVKYFRPMCQHTPTSIEFEAGSIYGAVHYYEGHGWSVST